DYVERTLYRLGAPAIPSLLEVLQNGHPNARARAARVLGMMGSDAMPAIPALTEALRDSSIRASAAMALWRIDIGTPLARPALLEELRDPVFLEVFRDCGPTVLAVAALDLEQIDYDLLKAVVESPVEDPETRAVAASALAAIQADARGEDPAPVKPHQ